MRRKAIQLARFLMNTIPGVSSRPKEKPEFSGIMHSIFGLTPHAAQYPEHNCS